ncbi:xylosyltransferase [Acrasis kona]|uniref:protein xylosyltransferase n=1 Tax=Acrasis kona TaxID=1008807 RepID=A0AAW2ZIU0_9EUKA
MLIKVKTAPFYATLILMYIACTSWVFLRPSIQVPRFTRTSTSDCNYGMPYMLNNQRCCVCPEFSSGDQCQTLLEGGRAYSKLVKMEIPWDGVYDVNEESQPMEEVPQFFRNYVDRIGRWGSGRFSCEIQKSEPYMDTVDHYFMEISKQFGPYTDNDALVMKMLHAYNKYMLVDGPMKTKFAPEQMPRVPGKILFILMFSKEADLAEFLMSNIYTPHNHYYIFTVSKFANDAYYNRMRRFAFNLPGNNVLVLPRELSIYGEWGDISLVHLEIIPVIHSLMIGWTDWSFKISLSETHFPVKKLSELSAFLATQNTSKVFFEHERKSTDRMKVVQACVRGVCRDVHPLSGDYHYLEQSMLNVPDYISGGSGWHIESRDVLMYIYSSRVCIDLLFMSKHGAAQDEMYFNNIFFLINRSKSWELVDGEMLPIDGKQIVTIDEKPMILTWIFWDGGASPRTILPEHFPDIKKTPGMYFARKVKNLDHMKQMVDYFQLTK